jgi:hypothetical protein
MNLPGYTAEASLGAVRPQQLRPRPHPYPIPFPLPPLSPCALAYIECYEGSQVGCYAYFSNNCYDPWSGLTPVGPVCAGALPLCLAGNPDACAYWSNCQASGPIGGGDGGGGGLGPGYAPGVEHG